MKRMRFDATINKELQDEREALVGFLQDQKIIQEAFHLFELDVQDLNQNPYAFQDYYDCTLKCVGCKGLDFCVQEKRGIVLSLKKREDEVYREVSQCKYQINQSKALAHQTNIRVNHMSIAQLQLDFDDISFHNEDTLNVAIVDELSYALKHKSKVGFYLCGNPGIGKSYLAACFANGSAKDHRSCCFVHVPTLVANLKSMMYDHGVFAKTIYDLKNCEVLILDDIGGESASGWSRDDILLPLLNERMEQNRCTLFTSNYSMDTLEKFYTLKSKAVNDIVGAKRLIERVRCLAKECNVVGDNRRAN